MDDSSILSGEPRSPTNLEASSGESQANVSSSMKRINPFEQVEASSQQQADANNSISIRGMEEIRGASSGSVPLSTSGSDSVSSNATPDRGVSTPLQPTSEQQQMSASMSGTHGIMQSTYGYDDDESTEPSSAVNSADPADPGSSIDGGESERGSISRFIDNARRRIGSTRKDPNSDDREIENVSDVDDDLLGENTLPGTLIGGYLKKLGRNGKWQSRWFETDGECLSYYKNEKRTKLLATLNLEKVGAITIDPEDGDGVSFTIQVLGRLYHLRADSKASCKDWVITLNRVKEARMQQGNVKLVSTFQQPVDLLDSGMPPQSDDLVAPRVVVMANRQRTKAVEEEQELNQLIRLEEEGNNQPNAKVGSSRKSEKKRLSTIGTVVYARWTKRRSSISRLSSKLANWARSIRQMGCASESAVGLDGHVHPPGHDDKNSGHGKPPTSTSAASKKKEGLSTWIGKETSISSRSPAPRGVLPPETEAPEVRTRKMSSASDADVRVLS